LLSAVKGQNSANPNDPSSGSLVSYRLAISRGAGVQFRCGSRMKAFCPSLTLAAAEHAARRKLAAQRVSPTLFLRAVGEVPAIATAPIGSLWRFDAFAG
jgi:hypothetical protein